MTGVETGLLITLAGVIGLTGGKMWGIKAVEDRFLPKKEHTLMCSNVNLTFLNKLEEAKKEIIEAVENNGAPR